MPEPYESKAIIVSQDVFDEMEKKLVQKDGEFYSGGLPVFVVKSKTNYTAICDEYFARIVVEFMNKE